MVSSQKDILGGVIFLKTLDDSIESDWLLDLSKLTGLNYKTIFLPPSFAIALFSLHVGKWLFILFPTLFCKGIYWFHK